MAKFFPFGAQYWRPPTPPVDDWAHDIENMAGIGMNIARAWLCWNWLNPAPGEFDFEQSDIFIDLLAKNKMKAIMLISLESVPQWVVDKCPEAIYTAHNGHKQYPEGYSNTPAGGFPGLCLDNEGVKKYASEYIKALVSQYKNRPNIYAWEPHNEPVIEPARRKFSNEDVYCYCDASVHKFRVWLKEKYKGNIESLNERWHRKYRYFDEVRPPTMQPHGTPSDFVEWRVFWMDNLADQLKWRIEQIKAAAPNAMIMAHTRAYSCVQGNTATWGMDDWRLSKHVDIFGGSMFLRGYPDEAYFLNNEAVASAAMGKPWFIAEMQGGPPHFSGDEPFFATSYTIDNFCQWTWIPIAQGSKGLMYWQYRMELAPPEYGFGMTALDGSETARTREAKRIGKLIKKNESFFLNAGNPQPLVALGYAPENTILEFLANGKADLNYNRIMGLYKTILYSDFYTEVVRLDDGVFDKDLSKYKVLAISGASWIGPKAAERIEKFVKNGGILIADLGFEYDENFYWSSTIPAYGLDKVFGCKRDICANYPDDTKPVATWNGRLLSAGKHRERVKLTTGKAIAAWNDDLTPAIILNNYDKGRAYYLAGEFFLNYYDSEEPTLLDFIQQEVTVNISRPVITTAAKVIPRVLMDANCWLVFAFNIDSIPAQSELIIDFAGKDVINFETGDIIDFQGCEGRVVITTNIPAKSTKIFKITR